MSEVISAIYEGNGLVRLEHEPEGVQPQERVAVFIVQTPVGKGYSIEKVGVRGLRQQLLDFEARYSWKTPEFYSRYMRGETGDNRDFIVWAGLHELLQRITDFTQPAVSGD